MGRKISVDSATMMNKALEVIEARYLFDLTPEQIEVVIHPQSIIHSMVRYRDTSVVAQLGTPDMRVPIAYGLALPGPHRRRARRRSTSLAGRMTSSVRSRPIASASPACSWPGTRCARAEGSTAVLNAANEVAVAAFLERNASASTRFTA